MSDGLQATGYGLRATGYGLRQFRLSFWDAMVVHAAAEAGADVLWTEDLTSGQVLRGVRISNPFASDIAT
jgi:predicted nucleic acid-binding protein